MIELKSSKSKSKFMEHVGVASWFRRLCNAQSDFAAKERIVWVDIEGVPLNAWTRSTFQKISSKWGELVELEDGTFCLVPILPKMFPEKENDLDDESAKINEQANNLNNDEVENASEVVSDTYFGDNGEVQGFEHQHGESNDKEVSSDPFNIYDLLDKRTKEAENSVDRVSSESFSNGVKIKEGGSILEILEEIIAVGQTMGFFMEGCTKDMEKIIGTQGEQLVSIIVFLNESPISNEEISHSPVKWFFDHGDFAIGCNSSFVALIPKVLDPKVVSDYRPISLIGSLYKVVTKILASRLSLVISDLISDVQTAFLPNRQILDGPFIINEILARCKLKKQQAMIFKVDFAKAYDSVRWDYLDDAVEAGIFKGYKIDPSTTLSRLFYADDTVFIESHLLGVRYPNNLVADDAKSIGCLIMKAPFKYLGILVGDNMSSKKAWNETINKIKKRLSRWKLNTLSIGGRLTLLKSVFWLQLLSTTMSDFQVPGKQVLNYMESLARNFLWLQRVIERLLGSMAKVLLQEIQGLGSFYFQFDMELHHIKVNSLKVKGVDLISHCKIRVGKGYGRTSDWWDSEVMKGLSECKASESNVRRIQVKDIVKKVEDCLKTYSSAGMDISWYVEGIR
ncbi:RNA-directed DNA polymerase, eukaryota [Tanacetum coccineum]|uniref:RNA-directed DNA polymerase, eukaryota n=1 Tax=Tanacetum coccineum TaxID=301880 RepID=A0ABQ5DN94_9ASTR